MVLPTSITRQRSFRPQSPTAYGPSGLHHLLRSVRPTSPDNGLSDPSFLSTTVLQAFVAYYGPSDLHQQTTVFLTPFSCRLRSPADYGPSG
ncbi:hypothetical protein KFK09_008749 [Dendrobium nobile]|uniref:Uncharacterized protein n=1 Tax=Dendrobium nobile TaxID=94219 RepID=A0A8T3BM07_DENNO|nr:hypothetical protein KFK09_008749 [Dendrobium nobile]